MAFPKPQTGKQAPSRVIRRTSGVIPTRKQTPSPVLDQAEDQQKKSRRRLPKLA